MRAALLAGGVALAATAALAQQASIPKYISAAVSDSHRPASDTQRDSYRLPAESIAFAGVKPGDKVGELIPGGGYFTRILAKVVGSKGHVWTVASDKMSMMGPPPGGAPGGAGGPPGGAPGGAPPGGGAGGPPGGAPGGAPPGGAGGPPGGPPGGGQGTSPANDPAYAGIVTATTKNLENISFPEPVDIVWTSLNYHDLNNQMMGKPDRAKMNKSIYSALKPGGLYIIIDHQAPPGAGFTMTDTQHRVEGAAVRKEVEAAGFVFDGESKILANPADKYTGRMSGETLATQSDKFFYRFKKPAK
jgi:predicted methyltransferase